MKKEIKSKAVFLDRDGIFNVAPVGDTYILSLNKLKIVDGIEKLVKRINDIGRLAIMITNQSCIEWGTLSTAGLNELHNYIHAHLAGAGAVLDGIYYCPHRRETGCACKKPKPGMILDAAKKFNIDLANSYMVGDRWFDVGAGKAAGCKTIFLLDGDHNKVDLTLCEPDFVVESLAEITPIIHAKES